MVKVQGPNSNRDMVKQATKKPLLTTTQPVSSHWCQASRARGCGLVWIRPGVIGLRRQATYEVIQDDHEHFEWHAWPCMIARWHHWRQKCSHVPYIALCLPIFSFEFPPESFTIGFYGKKIYQIRVNDFAEIDFVNREAQRFSFYG